MEGVRVDATETVPAPALQRLVQERQAQAPQSLFCPQTSGSPTRRSCTSGQRYLLVWDGGKGRMRACWQLVGREIKKNINQKT